MYVDAVRTKRLPNPGTSSFDTLETAQKDPLIMAKIYFYMSVIRTFSPFLSTYQTDVPMMPFLGNDLAELMKVIIFYNWTLWGFFLILYIYMIWQLYYIILTKSERRKQRSKAVLTYCPVNTIVIIWVIFFAFLFTVYFEAFHQEGGPSGHQSTPVSQTGCWWQKELGPWASACVQNQPWR